MTTVSCVFVYWDETADKYRSSFTAHGYERHSPWLDTMKAALKWASDYWSH